MWVENTDVQECPLKSLPPPTHTHQTNLVTTGLRGECVRSKGWQVWFSAGIPAKFCKRLAMISRAQLWCMHDDSVQLPMGKDVKFGFSHVYILLNKFFKK